MDPQDRSNRRPERYTVTAQALHWLMALLILANLPLGWVMTELALSPLKLKLYAWHKWIGVTLFLLAVLRLAWRATHAAPALPPGTPGWQRAAAGVSHVLLYLMTLAIPLSGWLMSSAKGFQTVWFGVLPIPDLLGRDEALAERLDAAHVWLNYTLAAVLSLHVAAALKHHYIDRDAVLLRMLPGQRAP